jgi:membrane-associated phospholipid phosphatase
MASNHRLTLRLRLEDLVALAFFLINLALRVFFRGAEHTGLGPADVLIIIPAVTLLLAKELVHYFVVGKKESSGSSADPRLFVRPYWEIVRDWFPFLVILLMYYSLWGDATHLLVPHDRDGELIVLDQRLFGFQASLAIQRFITPRRTAWMEFSYFFHILNIPIVACFVYLCRPRPRFREMMSGLMVVSFLGLLGYILVPAIGPMYTLHNLYTVPLSQPISLFNQQLEFMDFARIHRDVFPSMHVAISFLVWLYALRNSRPLFWILSPLIMSLWVSTVYLRYHYLIDVVAGLFLAPASFLLANWLFGRFGNLALPIPIPAAWDDGLARMRVTGTGKANKPPGRTEEQP